jgi:hypothetical protein
MGISLKTNTSSIQKVRIWMNLIEMLFDFIGNALKGLIILAICSNFLFIANKGNQPMAVSQAPKGMTYFEFIQDRIDAAKTVKPSRCGWGMILSLAVLGPVYSAVYTEVGIHPHGFIARGIAPDPDIPKGVEGAKWYQVPDIWWNTVERLSWTMLGEPAAYGCRFRRVKRID